MKNIRIALWLVLLVAAGSWLLADSLWPQPFNYFAFRGVAVQLSGVVTIAAMSVAMVLATRPRWLEPHLAGLDKMYRLHKWLGISALVGGLTHWWLAQGTKWMVGWGWLERPVRGPRPPGGTGAGAGGESLEQWLRGWRHLAENVGEWAFYAALVLMIVALVKRIPYRWFAKTHQLIAIAYLVLVFHALVLLKWSYWSQPVGWLVALLLLAGTVSALWVLTGRTGRTRTVSGQVAEVKYFAPLRVTRTTLALSPDWPGHAAGQFAFVTSDPREGAHPYTIASAWDAARRQVSFVTKALGDHTEDLHEKLHVGQSVRVEGPYGHFTFEDGAARQIWVAGGIGITPFIARMAQLSEAADGAPRVPVTLFHTTRDEDDEALALLLADAKAAGIELQVLVDARDGLLTGDRVRRAVPEWRDASLWFCGPAGFGKALRRDFAAHGLPGLRWHQELFEMR